jgi:hypothetical protein
VHAWLYPPHLVLAQISLLWDALLTLLRVQIRIRFHGVQSTRPSRRLQSDMEVNNKYWGILGNVSLHGSSAAVTVTTLASPAAAGATSITTAAAPDWAAGDELFITRTSHTFDAHDHAIVSSVAGNVVTLAAPLRHPHFGGAAPFTDAALASKTKFTSADTRARVVLLTRSIVVENVDSGDAWGPAIAVGQEIESWEENGLKYEKMCVSSCGGRSTAKLWEHACT